MLKRELAKHLQHNQHCCTNSKHIECLANINYVKVSKQVDFADIYVTVFDVTGQDDSALIIARLNEHSKAIRHALCSELNWRKMPALRFHTDEVMAHTQHIEEVLAGVKNTHS